jgi:very-short-patch-repair endonuclease
VPGSDSWKLSLAARGGRALSATPEERTLEDVALPTEVEGFTKRRVELVQKAAKEWTSALVDLGGRNNLLRYRDLKQGTLDLSEADARTVGSLLQGRTIKVSALFSDPEERERTIRRIRTIHNKAKENFEERGLETLSIACGLATWENKRAVWEPCAPVLLRQASLRPLGAAQDEFELALVDEMEINPTLLHLLKVDFDCDFDQDKLLDRVDGVIDEPWELQEAYRWMEEHARRVPSFRVEPRLVLANFAYAKLPMVKDIENAFDELVAHELIAAIAGDEDCREAIRSHGPGPDAIPGPDQTPLADEFLALDADSSQNYAINSVLAGQSLIVKGPPGTGKSQTIANLITSLVARDKKVLFVAEKRAAIDAVTKRLNQTQLGDLVLDLHGGVSSRRAFAQAVGHALVASRTATRIENGAELRKVEKRRDELNSYVEAIHDEWEPWDLSVYEIRAQLIALEPAKNEIRFRGEAVEALGGPEARQVEEDLAEYARLGGLTLATSGSPWASSPIVSSEEVQQAHAALDELRRHTLATVEGALGRASEETGLPKAATIAEWEPRIDLWGDVAETLSSLAAEIYERDLEAICERFAAASGGGLARMKAGLFSGDYKACREELRGLRTTDSKLGDHELYEITESARDDVREWRQLGGAGVPRAPLAVRGLAAPWKHLLEELERLEHWTGRGGLAEMPVGELRAFLDELLADRATLVNLPELYRLRNSLLAAGLEEFLDALCERQVSEEFAVRSFRYAWLQSILDHLSLAEVMIGGFVAAKHEKAIAEFKKGDAEHIDTTPARIRRICAENAVRARDAFKEQAALVQHQAGLKRRHLPVRDLVRNAADVLLALKPCWAMSPLVVSQLLPPKTYFDVVIFDEASQITPADAVSSILRGKQLVVAGDEKQLPPTAFFVSEAPEDEDEDEADELEVAPLVAGTKGFESILDALGSLLRYRMLLWHYRSRDERLIAFSNAHIYDRMLTTFPGVGGSEVLRYVPVPWEAGADTNSPRPEVNTVVDLILQHARERPEESLGVIAMGIRHANRIDECLRERLSDDPALADELSEFFDESCEERFFVKNLERVQGDERDAIILSIGYGKNVRGDLPYRFGPLLMEGGERRLNVAVTRAKNRVTLVASCSYRDMDPERSSAEGVKLLRQYLQYVESGGANLGDRVIDKPVLNPFEVDVRDTLARRGLKLTAQYGSSGYWIDFAVQHPIQPGRYVLALECDGATYHSSESARDRDRLRQEQLERIGWKFCRIWSSEWFYNKDAAVERVLSAYENAVRDADRPPEPQERDTGRALSTSPTTAEKPATRGRPRPPIRRGLPIGEYSPAQIVQLIRWIESDDQLRTEEEVVAEAMNELGFQRHGKKIVAALQTAVQQARR